MRDKISYLEAVNIIAKLEDYSKTLGSLNSFDRSLILAVLFEKDKTECLDDIIGLRI